MSGLPKRWIAGLLTMGLMVPMLAGCDTGGAATAVSATPTAHAANKPTITIGSKDFTEETLVGEMYAILLEQAGYKVDRKLNLGATKILQPALVKGDISIYPEYTGTGLFEVLGKTDPVSNPKAAYDIVAKEYQSQFKITWLDPAPMNDTNALATTKAIADKYGLKTLSDLAAKAGELRLVCGAEFPERKDGLPGLQGAYGGFKFKEVQIVDLSLKYQALLQGKADVSLAFSTDGEIAGNNLVVMKDDKNFFPPYQIAPLVRTELLTSNPDIATILNPLAPKLTDAAVSAMNWEVVGKKREVADVAKEFLKTNGLLK